MGKICVRSRHMDKKPKPNPQKLLDQWMEWERGETPPGRVISNLKTGGLPELLEQLIEDGNS